MFHVEHCMDGLQNAEQGATHAERQDRKVRNFIMERTGRR